MNNPSYLEDRGTSLLRSFDSTAAQSRPAHGTGLDPRGSLGRTVGIEALSGCGWRGGRAVVPPPDSALIRPISLGRVQTGGPGMGHTSGFLGSCDLWYPRIWGRSPTSGPTPCRKLSSLKRPISSVKRPAIVNLKKAKIRSAPACPASMYGITEASKYRPLPGIRPLGSRLPSEGRQERYRRPPCAATGAWPATRPHLRRHAVDVRPRATC